ncbi:MAG: hypothetical protein ACI382_05945 [Alloprevotella sp.]
MLRFHHRHARWRTPQAPDGGIQQRQETTARRGMASCLSRKRQCRRVIT